MVVVGLALELLSLLALLVLVLIIVIIAYFAIYFLPAIVIAAVIYFLTKSPFYTALAFLLVSVVILLKK